MMKLSQSKMRYFSQFGTGLLLGAALAVSSAARDTTERKQNLNDAKQIVLPEGIEAIYKHEEQLDGPLNGEDEHEHHEQARWVALALLGGFLFMYLVDVMQSHVHTHPRQSQRGYDEEDGTDDGKSPMFVYKQRNHSLIFARRISTRVPSANCPDPSKRISAEHLRADATPLLKATSSPSNASSNPFLYNNGASSPQLKGDDYFRPRAASGDEQSNIGVERPSPNLHKQNDEISSDSESGISVHGGTGARSLSTTIGLLVHSLADGISLGASSAFATASKDKHGGGVSLDIVVFIAIMVHKAPAAFGLVSVLIGDGWAKAKIRRALLAFSLAAPVGAVLTYMLLQLLGGRTSASLQWWTGIALLVSSGTFLFVATHVMQENSPEEDESGRQKLINTATMVCGMVAPICLQSIVGHAHG